MDIDFSTLDRDRRYKLITASVIPRPIAFVTTLNEDGSCNAAPFSAFNYVSEDPPLIVLGLELQPPTSPRAGEAKDTTRNIRRSVDFVVNFVDETMVQAMVDSAADFPAGDSEPAALGLPLTPSRKVAPPRIAASPIAMECRRYRVMDVGPARSVIFGQIVWMYCRDGIVDPDNYRLDIARYQPIGRLFGAGYVRLSDLFWVPTRSHADLQREGHPRLPGSRETT